MTDSAPRVVVIGAGIAGLAAARTLQRAHIPVTVLEKGAIVGGRIHTDQVDGFAIDTGAQFLAGFYRNTLRLIHELGLQSDLAPIPGRAAILRGGRLYEQWPDLRLLFGRLVSLRSKLRLLAVVPPLLQHWADLDIHALDKAAPLDSRSLATYARAALGGEMLEYVLQPAFSGIFYWTPEETSQVLLFLALKAGLRLQLYTLRHGMGRLPEALAASLTRQGGAEVRCDAEVLRVLPAPGGRYTVEARVAGQVCAFPVAGVVCATLATDVPGLFPDLTLAQRAFFESVPYAPNTTMAIGVGRRLPSRFYGLLFPRREAPALANAAVQSAKNPAQLPPGRDLLVLYPSGPAARVLLPLGDAEIRARLLADLARAGPAYLPGRDALFTRVYRRAQAIPEFPPGQFRRLAAFARGEIESGRIVFAGDYLGGPFVEGAITSGQAAAARLRRRLDSP